MRTFLTATGSYLALITDNSLATDQSQDWINRAMRNVKWVVRKVVQEK